MTDYTVKYPVRDNVAYKPEYIPKRQQKQPENTAQKKSAVSVRQKTRIRFGTILVFLAVAAMMAVVVHNYMQLSELSVEASKLRKELKEQHNQADALSVKMESKMTIAEIEDYAVNRLGMIKMTRSNIEYITLTGEDRTMIIQNGTVAEDGNLSYFLIGLTGGVNKLVEYFD